MRRFLRAESYNFIAPFVAARRAFGASKRSTRRDARDPLAEPPAPTTNLAGMKRTVPHYLVAIGYALLVIASLPAQAVLGVGYVLLLLGYLFLARANS